MVERKPVFAPEPEPQPNISKLTSKQNLDEKEYSQLLNIYVKEVNLHDKLEKERQRQHLMEKAFGHSIFDLVFPYHMWIGKLENYNRMETPTK